jgi:hypothetical protein
MGVLSIVVDVAIVALVTRVDTKSPSMIGEGAGAARSGPSEGSEYHNDRCNRH